MATMKDVARLAKVSTSTVSHVINSDRYVSPQIKERVEAAIKELNYAPSALARSLKIKETKTIGMVLTTSNNPFFSEVVQGVELSCYELGYNLILCNTEGNKKRLQDNIETLLSKSVDGILVICTETDSLTPDIFARYPSLPIVMMDWAPFHGVCDVIQDNSLLGATLATQYLIENGYQDIACITGPLSNPQAQLRLQGYRVAMQQANLKIKSGYEAEGDFMFRSGYEAMTKLLALKKPPEAVFCCNDAMAIGAYQALYQAGLEAGKDIAMIGYDDIELAQYMTPPLTTIHQPKSELGQLAVETLLHRLKHKDEEPEVLTLTPILQKRRSVNPKAPA
ncbi:ribose operon transcriptional repressor RbsR [Zophobihabitans entericus]|uniref:Ribose operon transcriptional repressor RbsR n=1 Tax=Zophobihabitans entericus TaxID=1635327 RepID=A0A6G9IBD6_9GAMM|nr:ribose operon transcriptional repressor RbsR [Zophobihabitans entericus]